jgi:hypothetical protein
LLGGQRRRFPSHEIVQRLAGFVRDKFDKGRVIDETWKRASLPVRETRALPRIDPAHPRNPRPPSKNYSARLRTRRSGDKIGFLWLNMWWAT